MLGFSYQVVQEKNSKVWPKDYFSNIKMHIIGIFWYYEKKNSYCYFIHTLAYTPLLQGIYVPCECLCKHFFKQLGVSADHSSVKRYWRASSNE